MARPHAERLRERDAEVRLQRVRKGAPPRPHRGDLELGGVERLAEAVTQRFDRDRHAPAQLRPRDPRPDGAGSGGRGTRGRAANGRGRTRRAPGRRKGLERRGLHGRAAPRKTGWNSGSCIGITPPTWSANRGRGGRPVKRGWGTIGEWDYRDPVRDRARVRRRRDRDRPLLPARHPDRRLDRGVRSGEHDHAVPHRAPPRHDVPRLGDGSRDPPLHVRHGPARGLAAAPRQRRQVHVRLPDLGCRLQRPRAVPDLEGARRTLGHREVRRVGGLRARGGVRGDLGAPERDRAVRAARRGRAPARTHTTRTRRGNGDPARTASRSLRRRPGDPEPLPFSIRGAPLPGPDRGVRALGDREPRGGGRRRRAGAAPLDPRPLRGADRRRIAAGGADRCSLLFLLGAELPLG